MFLLCSLLAFGMTLSPGAEPFSGVYVHPAAFANPDLSSEAREGLMESTLDAIHACGFTTVIPYANTSSGKVYWPGTNLEIAGAPDWDTLGIFAGKARARGLKVMPAICVLVSGHDAPAGILQRHPEWGLYTVEGEPLGWISPAHKAARSWVTALAVQLVNHIRPDGVLLDYVRFPNRADVFLDLESGAEFDAAAPASESAGARKQRLQEYKERALTALMKDLAQALRACDASLRIGLYSWGPHVPFNHPVAQCWPEWMREGWLDLLNVSGYCYRDNYGEAYLDAFEKRLRDAGSLARQSGGGAELSFALGVKTSHGAIPDAEEIAVYLEIARRLGYTGVAAFAWGGLEPHADAASEKGYFKVSTSLAPETESRFSMTVDFGRDVGQHFGSLFQVTDASGDVIAGAGFMGAYNTYYRSDRFMVHLFVRPTEGEDMPQYTLFKRPTEGNHHYLFDVSGDLYASDRKSPENTLHWNAAVDAWEDAGAPSFQAGTRRFSMLPNRLVCEDRPVFSFDPSVGTAGIYYYAAGALFFHVATADSPERCTFLHACPWDPDADDVVHADAATIVPLEAPGEFPYAYGQLHGDVYTATNNGGVYRFRDGKWDVLRPSDPKTSYQIYTMLNYHDRLLMGQYPTGELFEIVGDEIIHLLGWPPRPPEASSRAREAQSLALYRGELFAGVWPWGEVWRLSGPAQDWSYAGRMFTHPEITPAITAPYEQEMNLLSEPVYNLWGQRITSLVPFSDMLLVSTSNKNGALFEERLRFLADGRHAEYGAVHGLTLPGHQSVPMVWTGRPVQFGVHLSARKITLLREGEMLASLPLPRDSKPAAIHWGRGVFGPLHGRIDQIVSGENSVQHKDD